VSQPQRQPRLPHDAEEVSRADKKALRLLASRTMPLLFEVGNWVFGGLIAVNLVLISALITVGPVDTAILVSITAFGIALPLDVAGISLLRLVKSMDDAGIEDLTLQAYTEAGYPGIEAYRPTGPEREEQQKKRAILAVWYASAIAGLSIVLTATGLVAALWFVAWWIGVVVLCVGLLSPVLVVLLFVHAQPRRPEAEIEQKARYADIRSRQGRR
jgi:hypothetical protein